MSQVLGIRNRLRDSGVRAGVVWAAVLGLLAGGGGLFWGTDSDPGAPKSSHGAARRALEQLNPPSVALDPPSPPSSAAPPPGAEPAGGDPGQTPPASVAEPVPSTIGAPVAEASGTSPTPKPRPEKAASAPAPAAMPDGRRLAWPGEGLPASLPVTVEIPAVGITAPVDPLGLNADGTLEVPEDFARAGYYTGRPTPGEEGPSVVVAHRGGSRSHGAFWRLPSVQPGQVVNITRADGQDASFVIERVEQHEKDRFPTEEVYGPVPFAALRLVTCGGPYSRLADHYRDNIIVFARLLR